MIDAVGLLDPTITFACDAIDDWVMRAQTLGFIAKRANHAYVQHGRLLPKGYVPAAPLEPTPGAPWISPTSDTSWSRFSETLDGTSGGPCVAIAGDGESPRGL